MQQTRSTSAMQDMMNLLLVTTLLFSGLCTISCSSVPRQFHVVKELKNWTEAQQYCREKFTDLATIDNMAEMEKLKSLIQEADGNVWIGLKNGITPKWQWSLADRDFYREKEAVFRNWNPGQPHERNNEIYVAMRYGKWFDAHTSTFSFICYDGKNSTHPYVLVNEGKTWEDAQRYCRENHTDLASVRNQEENDQIEEVSVRDIYVWIGLFRDAWEWSDGSNSSFRHWGSGEPNAKGVICTEITQDGLWNDVGCHEHRNFICYGAPKEKKKQIMKVQFQVDSQVNINDPAIQEALLQQIQQRLRDKGMPADAKLTWRKQPDGQIFHKEKKKGKKRMKRDEF